jgi:hypothetical protein
VVAVHSAVPLDRQINADAATWLDRQLVGRHRVETAPMGFGAQVERALQDRKQQLIARGFAAHREDGSVRYQPDLLATCSAASWIASASASPSSAPTE